MKKNASFAAGGFKSREELETMIAEMDGQLDVLYRRANVLSRPIIWANLTNAVLKLLAPEDQDYAYERMYALFKNHQERGTGAGIAASSLPSSGAGALPSPAGRRER